MSSKDTCIYLGQALADYGFKDGHPFGPQRHDAFQAELIRQGLDKQLAIQTPVAASSEELPSREAFLTLADSVSAALDAAGSEAGWAARTDAGEA